MLGNKSEHSNLNYLPFITTLNGNRNIRLLIDTGANKNVIRPGILTNVKSIRKTEIKNISGNHIINQKGRASLLGPNVPLQTYYELEFHNFFDGIIGSQFLAKNRAKIDYEREEIKFSNITIPFEKYFPAKKLHSYQIELDTTTDGDWLVPSFQKLCNTAVIEPGLYRSRNKKTTVKILTNKRVPPCLKAKLEIRVNNFETVTPIPINGETELDETAISNFIRMDHLSKMEKQELIKTVLRNQAVLLKADEKLTATTAIKHQIHTSDEKPTYTKSYRYPHHFKRDVEEQISEMLRNGIISHSTSPYSSPIWVVPKKLDASGKRKVRVVIDYRKLNDKTIDDKFPIPQIEDILDSLGKSVYFTTLDLKSGFHQIEMDPSHKAKTAFSTDQGHFEFTRMPFGLKNAPATFQRAMNNILHDFIGAICYVYLDDIIIVGYNLKNHIENVNKILKRLSEFNLKIQLDKCEFLKRETEFLGHVITPDGVKPDPSKITKILDWKIPTTQKEIKQFLGLTGYYRRFIRDYAKLAKPLTKYLKKEQNVNTKDEDYKNGFEKLKLILTSDQILAYPDFNIPFILTTDASNYALGAVLSQIQDNIERPIAFGSRTLHKAEINYSTTEKEALAIIWAVDKFRNYLHGNKFTLITDHKPLTFIKNSTKNCKILRWRLDLENFDYDVKYRQGKTNVVADALSRKTEDSPELNTNSTFLFSDNTRPKNYKTENKPTKRKKHTMNINNNENSFVSDTTSNPGEQTISESSSPAEELDIDTDSQTVHSADTSDDYFIHCVERPLNYYKNQIIFKISRLNTDITETPFTHFHRTIICRDRYDEDIIKDVLLKYHNNRQTAIMAPEHIIPIIQEVYKTHFNQKGHFVLTQLQVEDVANEQRQDIIINKEHNRAHRGVTEVDNQLKRSYFFPRMTSKIKMVTQTCRMCNMHKYERKPYNIKLSPRPTTDKPFDRVHMDIFQINRHNFLSLVDSFSKHAQMIFMETKNLTDVKTALADYFGIYGTPRKIITDHETTFMSLQLKNYLDALNIELAYASCSESNGQVEKTHSTIIEIINTNKYKFPDIDTTALVKLAISLYNSSIHSATKFTPNEVIFNNNNLLDPNQIEDNSQKVYVKVKANIEKARSNQENQNNNKENPPHLENQQEVFLIPNIRKKLDPRAKPTNANAITDKTFKNNKAIKRHKNKIKRCRKS